MIFSTTISADNNILNIDIGLTEETVSFHPAYSGLCFTTDKFDNIYIYDYSSMNVKVFSYEGKYLKSWNYDKNIDIKSMRISDQNLLMLVGYKGLIISGNYLHSETWSNSMLITSFSKYYNYLISNKGIYTYNKKGGVKLFRPDGSYIEIKNFNTYDPIESLVKGSSEKFSGDNKHIDNNGFHYVIGRGNKEFRIIKIYDSIKNVVKEIEIPIRIENMFIDSIKIGYWGDILIARTVGEYVEEDIRYKIEGKEPTAYSFEKIPNTWSHVKGNYFAEVAERGLNSDNSEEVLSIIETLDKEELRRFRNTLFAIKGYMFNSEDLNTYFRLFDWYKPNVSVKNSKELLSLEQQKLLDAILKQEQGR